ncbi:MAG: hypothetical protein EXR81_01255 [Gammaproteobacteria bacterium]|nr:hypothetical protein [Gammaproteobacteria bacterium]
MAKLAHTERRPSIFSNMLKLRTASTSLPPSQANMIAENDILLFFFDPQPSASVSPPFLAVKTEAVMSSLTSPSAAYPADAPPLYGNVLQREHPGSAHPGSASPKPTNPFPKNTASRAADNPPFAPTNQTVVNAGAIPTASYNPFEDTSASRLTPPISAAYPTDAPPLYGNVPQRAHPDSAPPKRTNPFLKSPASLAADNPPFAPTNQTVVNAGAIPTASYNPFDETSDS